MIDAWDTAELITGTPAGAGSAAAPSAPAPSGGGTATATAPAPAATAAVDPAIVSLQEGVTELVDKYVCHPAAQDWWQPILREEASRVGGGP